MVSQIVYLCLEYDELMKVDNQSHLMKSFDDTSDEAQLGIPFFCKFILSFHKLP